MVDFHLLPTWLRLLERVAYFGIVAENGEPFILVALHFVEHCLGAVCAAMRLCKGHLRQVCRLESSLLVHLVYVVALSRLKPVHLLPLI